MLNMFLIWDENTTLSLISLIVAVIGSVAFPLAMFFINKSNQKKIRIINMEKYQKDLELEANRFIFNHSEDIKYIPLCFITSNLYLEDFHLYNRKVFNDFRLCKADLKIEILKQVGIDKVIPPDSNWIDKAIDLLVKDLDKYKLRNNSKMFYEGNKYFHRGFTRYNENEWEELERNYSFERICKNNILLTNKINLSSYIEDYLYAQDENMLLEGYEPLDVLWYEKNLGNTNESYIVGWTIEFVISVCCNIKNKEMKPDRNFIAYEDEMVETFEDAYLIALVELYDCYYQDLK